MKLFNRNKTSNDKKVYAFIGLGTMAKFLGEEKLNDFVNTLPLLIGKESGVSPDNIVIVDSHIWSGKHEFANSINFDGTPAFPDAAQKICTLYLKRNGLHNHVVGDLQLLGVLDDKNKLYFITSDELKKGKTKIIAPQIFVTAWLAFNKSIL
ncbi:MAG: hypothetical protein FWG22_00365 [Prolixibacteraceae bacterium]|nr:hypothetical protein [Prolixibacteraceae bacterium]